MTTVTQTVPALTRVPRGHWRNHWRYEIPFTPAEIAQAEKKGAIILDLFNAFGFERYPSRQIAEQRALEEIADRSHYAIGEWVGSQFFPDA